MFRNQLQILTFLSFLSLNYSILTFAGNLPNPNSPVHNTANPEFVPSTIKQPNFGFAFGRGNAIATGLIIVITLLDIAVYKLRQIHEANIGEILNIPPSLLSSEKLCHRFSLADILSATHNFDDELVVGRGGFGKVYKGIIDNGSISVAVKRLNRTSKQGAPQFWTEIELLSKFRHSNLVSLIGYCIDCNEMILVYEYMVHGALSDHLYKIGRNDVSNSTLCWVQRLKICIGAARGLEYLHTGTGVKHRVIHRDIKSSNILLDENWAAKISDFGLSRIGPANQSCTHVSTKIKGTFGYLDPEYLLTHKLTKKSDVYAFGIVLFEVLCGRLVVDLRLREDQWGLAGWAQHYIEKGTLDQIVDPNLRWQILPNSLTEFFQIADQCLHYRSKKRPTMTEVVASLELALALQERKDSSMIEEECFNLGIVGADDIQENAGYSIEQQKVINVDNMVQLGDANSRQSRVKPGRMMAFTRMVRSFFVGKVQVTPELPGALELQTSYFTLRQIKAATSNFDSANKIGEGEFGPVYKGVLSDGSEIAVKQLSSKSKQGNREFVNEIGMISALQHPNLVKLYGCCIERNQLLLVYEYLENNSLARALFAPNFTILGRKKQRLNLDWPTRKEIFLGIARGLSYLHEESRLKIVHRDIKATNVLLDKDLKAKISDFGLAKLDEEENTHISTRIAGTIGYMAPEYAMRGYLTDKADVYSFGIVALEIVSGKRNTNYAPKGDFVYLLDWAYVLEEQGNLLELVDPILGSNYNKEEAMRMLNLALLCTNTSPTLRPSMSSVVSMLEGKIPIQVSLIKRRFKAFETLSQDSQTKVSDVSHNSQEPRSMSMDGPWIDSSFSVQSNEIIRQLEQG